MDFVGKKVWGDADEEENMARHRVEWKRFEDRDSLAFFFVGYGRD